MPLLDVSDVLNSPEFSTTFTVIHRAQTVGPNGRAVDAVATFNNIQGVVTPEVGLQLYRAPDGSMQSGNISVVSKFPLQSGNTSDNDDGDVVVWNGNYYLVFHVQDYTQFGSGFTVAKCTLSSIESGGKIAGTNE